MSLISCAYAARQLRRDSVRAALRRVFTAPLRMRPRRVACGLAVAAVLLAFDASAADQRRSERSDTPPPSTSPQARRPASVPDTDVRKPFSALFVSPAPDQSDVFRSRLDLDRRQGPSYTRRAGPCGMVMIEHEGSVDAQARVPAPAGNFATRRMTPTVCSQEPSKP